MWKPACDGCGRNMTDADAKEALAFAAQFNSQEMFCGQQCRGHAQEYWQDVQPKQAEVLENAQKQISRMRERFFVNAARRDKVAC